MENAVNHEEFPQQVDEPHEGEGEERANDVDEDMGGEEWPASPWSIPRARAHTIGSQARAANEVIKAIRLGNIHTIYVPAEIDFDHLRRR